MTKRILITGGAGFIGSALVRQLIAETDHIVINVDILTYAGNLDSVATVAENSRHHFERADICDGPLMEALLLKYQPDAIIHLAAESHVDRSIDRPAEFIRTNIVGTYTLLETARRYWDSLNPSNKRKFRFIHVSTDEVFGSLEEKGFFTEETPYRPNSPYSASKASSDHLVRAWYNTYGLPVIVTNCSNNYGPYQFPEKLIPTVILNAIEGKPIPVYGEGNNIRDWLYVEDHCRALRQVLEKGEVGETYLVGGNNEKSNLSIVKTICSILDELKPGRVPYESLITFVKDRPGHDFRYALDADKIRTRLGWSPIVSVNEGLHSTVKWYLDHPSWWKKIQTERYQGERLGVIK